MRNLPVFRNFKNELDRLYDKFITDKDYHLLLQDFGDWYPEVDIEERADKYVIKANLPGIDPKDVSINFGDGLLNIKGKYKLEKKEKESNYVRNERFSGEFSRSFSLPNTEKDANILAEFNNGVLNIDVSKSKKTEMRRIEVKY